MIEQGLFDGSAIAADYVQRLSEPLVKWGPLATFAALFLECVPIVGFAVPGLTVLVLAGFLSSAQSLSGTSLNFVAAIAGVVAADNLGFVIGRLGGQRWSAIRRLIAKHETLRQELAAQGLPVLTMYQFPPYSRMFAPLLLGAIGMSWPRWMRVVTIGSLAFVTAFFALGYAAGIVSLAAGGAIQGASTASAAFLILLFIWMAMLARRVRRRQAASVLSGRQGRVS